MRRKRVTTLVLLAALGLLPLPAHAAPHRESAAQGATVTLVTGDRVTLLPGSGVKIDPAPGREHVLFHRRDTNGRTTVIPDDALPGLAAHRLDPKLFDVTDLLAQGFREDLPVLVATPARALKNGRTLPRLGLTAASLSTKDRIWPLGEKVWLDGKVRATLDQSVPMIGAPEAWQAGLRGTGVKVAVLDTGYDPAHPDLHVTDAKGFTDAGPADVADHVGHGTHVASTIAGRGAKYTGVAPDATLIVGKVLDDSGSGSISSILAGMEWAADSGARVVNMSLGTDSASDGTGILDQAVNDLTAKTGTLFVTAAGNRYLDHTIGSPGAADAALTVASVTKAGAISDFSSRGPRSGDEGVKPEIAAPGSDITAARAAGTSGEGLYRTMSGTSMATPHVAGAAALLAQRNPTWKATDLKSALVTTAKPVANESIYAQGGGIVNVPNALATTITTDVASVGFGELGWPWSTLPVQHKNITYRNNGDQPQTLAVAASIDAPTGLFSIEPTTLSVPAHGTAQATVTLTPSAGQPGLRGGAITSTVDGKPGPKVLLGASLQDERYELTIKTVRRDGAPASLPNIFLVNKEGTVMEWPVVGDQGVTVRVPKGTYSLAGNIVDRDEGFRPHAVTSLAQMDFTVDTPSTVVLDARGSQPVQVRLDGDPDARQLARDDGIGLRLAGGLSTGAGMSGPAELPFYAQPVRNPKLSYYTNSLWARPRVTLTAAAPERFEVPVEYAINSTPIGDITAGIVDAKTGQPDEIAGLDLKGKIALLREADDTAQQVANVAGAGAVAAVFAPSRFGQWFDQPTRIPVVSAGLTFDRLSTAASARMHGNDIAPTGYHVMQQSIGELPAGKKYQFTKRDLVAVENDYRAPGASGPTHNLSMPVPAAAGFMGVLHLEAKAPMRRVEYYTPGKWRQWVSLGLGDSAMQELPETTFERGKTYRTVWYQGVFAPRLDWPERPPVSRAKDVIQAVIPMWSGATSWDYGVPDESDSGSTTLSLNGKPLQTVPAPGSGYWQGLPAEPGSYELSTTAIRNNNPAFQRSTEIRSTWRFPSAATETETRLPLLDPRYNVPLDENDRGGGAFTVTVKARTFKAFASFDGTTWKQLSVLQLGDCWFVQSPGGQSGQMVSLRVSADAGDRGVDQTLINAYQVR
ncbi:S8 family serine peptidase [Actinocrispum sp. NPDC049592]|uniref:S8 family peptidase n=1 Tax=Actinocrispum sp. NPDC049592 TaxID=3154835 RepID=UPI00342FBA9E